LAGVVEDGVVYSASPKSMCPLSMYSKKLSIERPIPASTCATSRVGVRAGARVRARGRARVHAPVSRLTWA
jgi:hypothetical protein